MQRESYVWIDNPERSSGTKSSQKTVSCLKTSAIAIQYDRWPRRVARQSVWLSWASAARFAA